MSSVTATLVRSDAVRPWRYPSELIDCLALRDGRVVVVRPVADFDAPAQQDFVPAGA